MVHSNNSNACVTMGSDGQLKLWDYINRREVFNKKFVGSGLCIDWMPYSQLSGGRVLAAGFDNGIVRVIGIGSDSFSVLNAFKAHDSPVTKIKYSPDCEFLVSAAKDGTVFFFEVAHDNLHQYTPLCMVQLPA